MPKPQSVPAITFSRPTIEEMVADALAVADAVTRRLARDPGQAVRDLESGGETLEIDEAISVLNRHGPEMWMRSGREILTGYDPVGSPLDG